MFVERGQRAGGDIAEDLDLRGQITGNATVRSGVHFVLRGQVAGTLTVDPGARATINGMVTRDLVNRGEVEIHGTIGGRLLDESGRAVKHPGASIDGLMV